MEFNVPRIEIVPDLGSTPARVNRRTGTVYISKRVFSPLSKRERNFVLAHEEGHYRLNTSVETKADEYAMKKYAGTEPFSLKNTLKILRNTLDVENNPGHRRRLRALEKAVLRYDAEVYGNKKAQALLDKIESENFNGNMAQENISEIIRNLQVDYLKQLGITDVNALTEEQKTGLLYSFMKTPQMQYVLKKKTDNVVTNYCGYDDDPEFMEGYNACKEWCYYSKKKAKRKEKKAARKAKRKEKRAQGKGFFQKVGKVAKKVAKVAGKVTKIATKVAAPVVGAAATAFGMPGVGNIVNKIAEKVNPFELVNGLKKKKNNGINDDKMAKKQAKAEKKAAKKAAKAEKKAAKQERKQAKKEAKAANGGGLIKRIANQAKEFVADKAENLKEAVMSIAMPQQETISPEEVENGQANPEAISKTPVVKTPTPKTITPAAASSGAPAANTQNETPAAASNEAPSANQNGKTDEKTPVYKKWWFWAGIIAVLGVGGFLIFKNKKS
ncbi:MAG: hypothetical protein IKR41_11655 [Bacteroidales bacterium]|nr:hypothetical protein [Bacteroidales bacterium]